MKTKVTVLKEQGIDEAGNKYPALCITDGTHECGLIWEFDSIVGWVTAADCYYQIYHNNFEEFSKSHRETRQIWVLAEQDDINVAQLAEQEKEALPNSTKLLELCKASFDGYVAEEKRNGNSVEETDYGTFQTGFMAGYFERPSTRIAELGSKSSGVGGSAEGYRGKLGIFSYNF